MNKIARTIATALGTTGIAATLLVGGSQAATAAPAAAPTRVTLAAAANPTIPTTYLRQGRQATFWEAVRRSNGGLSYTNTMWAGNLACAKKEQYGLYAQVGTTRARIADRIASDVNTAYYGGRNFTAAKVVASKAATDLFNHCRL